MNFHKTRVSVETVLPIYSTLKFEHPVKVCAFLRNRPSRLARKRGLASDTSHTVQHCTGTLLWYLIQLVLRSHHLSSHHCVNVRENGICLRSIYFFRKRAEGTPSEPQNPEGGYMKQKGELVHPKESVISNTRLTCSINLLYHVAHSFSALPSSPRTGRSRASRSIRGYD
jgi:hypothetical protein